MAQTKKVKQITIERIGEKLIVPDNITYKEAADACLRQDEAENTIVQTVQKINAFPLDGAVAFSKVLAEKFGWQTMVPTPGFFGPQPPVMVSVEVGYEECIQVPWGDCVIPTIEGKLSTGFTKNDVGMPIFQIVGTMKRKDEHKVLAIADAVRAKLKTDSIYKGKAIKMSFRDQEGERIEFSPEFAPKFMDLTRVKGNAAVYNDDVAAAVNTNLFNPVKYSDRCRKQGIPLKRGVLLEGRFGVGKTLTAYQLASACVENKWTFLYIEDVRDLDVALHFAKMYEPCVLFGEDVDRTAGGDRNSNMDKLLNSLDGVESKDSEIVVVLTTNKIEAINDAFIRPGRIDTIIHVAPPDAKTLVKLVRRYGVDKAGKSIVTGTDEELVNAISRLSGANAAFAREAVERAKLSAIANGDEVMIGPADLETAVISMMPHVERLTPREATVEVSAGDLFVNEIADTVIERSNGHVKKDVAVAVEKTINKIVRR